MNKHSKHLSIYSISIGLSFFLFVIVAFFIHFTFQADDYRFLAFSTSQEGLPLNIFGSYWARVPIWCIFTWLLFFRPAFTQTWISMFFVLLVHISCFVLLCKYLVQKTQTEIKHKKNKKLTFLCVFILFIFTFYPNYYEILYWHTCFAYILGLFFLVLGLYTRKKVVAVLALTLSFLSSEMFIVPSICILLFPKVLTWTPFSFKRSVKDVLKSLYPSWIFAAFFTIIIRLGLSLLFSPYAYGTSFRFKKVFHQIIQALLYLFTMNFYKTYWAASIVFIIALISLFAFLYKKKILNFTQIILTVFLLIFSTATFWIVRYSAVRALYGAGLFFNAFLVVFLFRAIKEGRWLKPITVLSLVIGLVFLTHTAIIFLTKNHNFYVLKELEKDLIFQMEKCPEPCCIKLHNFNEKIKRDWVLPEPSYWIYYATWIKNREFKKKNITFQAFSQSTK